MPAILQKDRKDYNVHLDIVKEELIGKPTGHLVYVLMYLVLPKSKIDLAKGYGVAELSLAGLSIGLGTLLRNIFTLMSILRDEGIALHAAGILKNGRVYVFMGPSGSGKTTVAKLSKEYTVLSDDLVIIKPIDGAYCAFPTPCWLDMQRGYRENRPYPIGGIFKLVKDDKIYLKEIPGAIKVLAAADHKVAGDWPTFAQIVGSLK